MTSNNKLGLCDFCKRPNPTWEYPCKDFIMLEVRWGSQGSWAACEDCAEFIEKDCLDELAFLISGLEVARELAANGMELNSQTEVYHTILYGKTRQLYALFNKNRKGTRVLV